MDAEVAAALEGLRRAPGDEHARRVLSDVLQERGDPRGEFLVLTTLLAQHQGTGAMRARAAELFRRHRREWLKDLEGAFTDIELRAGFPIKAAFVERVTPEALQRGTTSVAAATLEVLQQKHAPAVEAMVEVLNGAFVPLLHDVSVLRGVAERLRRERPIRTVTAPMAELALVADSPLARSAQSLQLVAGQASGGSLATLFEAVRPFPSLTRLSLVGAGEYGRWNISNVNAVVAAWLASPLETFEVVPQLRMTREGGVMALSLQWLTTTQLIALAKTFPPVFTRVTLAPSDYRRPNMRAALQKAWAPREVQVLP
jgi:hypothetical protein